MRIPDPRFNRAYLDKKVADDMLLKIVRDWDIDVKATGRHLQ